MILISTLAPGHPCCYGHCPFSLRNEQKFFLGSLSNLKKYIPNETQNRKQKLLIIMGKILRCYFGSYFRLEQLPWSNFVLGFSGAMV